MMGGFEAELAYKLAPAETSKQSKKILDNATAIFFQLQVVATAVKFDATSDNLCEFFF